MNILYFAPLAIQGWESIIIALVILLLFGGKKIPELMRGLGKGVKSFKKGMQDVEDDVNDIRQELKTVDAPKEKAEKKAEKAPEETSQTKE